MDGTGVFDKEKSKRAMMGDKILGRGTSMFNNGATPPLPDGREVLVTQQNERAMMGDKILGRGTSVGDRARASGAVDTAQAASVPVTEAPEIVAVREVANMRDFSQLPQASYSNEGRAVAQPVTAATVAPPAPLVGAPAPTAAAAQLNTPVTPPGAPAQTYTMPEREAPRGGVISAGGDTSPQAALLQQFQDLAGKPGSRQNRAVMAQLAGMANTAVNADTSRTNAAAQVANAAATAKLNADTQRQGQAQRLVELGMQLPVQMRGQDIQLQSAELGAAERRHATDVGAETAKETSAAKIGALTAAEAAADQRHAAQLAQRQSEAELTAKSRAATTPWVQMMDGSLANPNQGLVLEAAVDPITKKPIGYRYRNVGAPTPAN